VTSTPLAPGSVPPALARRLMVAICWASVEFGLSRLSVPGATRPRFGFEGLRRLKGTKGKRRLPKPPAVLTVTKVGKTLRDWLTTAPRIWSLKWPYPRRRRVAPGSPNQPGA
jgi:hypothetical protein